jgi:hypothetical protein
MESEAMIARRMEEANKRPISHIRAPDPSQDPQGDLGYFILRELLALPPAVLNAPVFRKVKGHLENYRKHYT